MTLREFIKCFPEHTLFVGLEDETNFQLIKASKEKLENYNGMNRRVLEWDVVKAYPAQSNVMTVILK